MMPLVLQPEVHPVPLSALAFLPSIGWFTDCGGPAAFYICPLVPHWARSLWPWLCDPARCPLSCSVPSGQCAPGPSLWASCCSDPSSLCGPRGESSDPVSADGVLQEPCQLLTVLLHTGQRPGVYSVCMRVCRVFIQDMKTIFTAVS